MNDSLTELTQRHQRLQVLYKISNIIHSTLEPKEALRLLIVEAVNVLNASSGSVVLINPTNGFLEIEAAQGLPPQSANLKLRVGEGITGWVAGTGKPARVGNVSADSRYVMVRPNVRSELAVPLYIQDELRGVLNVDSDRADAFTENDQELLQSLADQAATVIRNTWVYEQTRGKAWMFETLSSVSQTINSTLNLDEALRTITQQAAALMHVKMCSLLLLDPTREWLDLRASFGAGQAYIGKPRLSVTDSLMGVVVRRRKPMQVENVQTSGRYQQVVVAREEGLISLLSVPLIFKGEAIGTLNVYTTVPHSFSNEEIHALTALAELSAIAIEKARLYERVVDMEEQLRQNERLSALGLLAAEVAHEIRNPLTVMKMLYHSLNLDFPKDDPRSKDVKIIEEKMNLLNKIVEQILSFARNVEPKLGLVNLNEIINDLILLTRHKLQNHQITLMARLAPELPILSLDAAQMEQAFLNLVLNAVEAMPRGGQLTITTKLQGADKDSGQVVIEFKDTGEGMSPEQRERAFKSLLSTTKRTGTGLGLAIVRRVIEAHQGEIGLKSERGKGTLIRITLPANP
jgi:signal transduction histidine kinase